MSFEDYRKCITVPASADLSTKQFHLVEIDANGQIAVVGAGVHADGVLQDTPNAAGRAGLVAVGGTVRVICGGVVTRGGAVAADSNGKAVNAASTAKIVGTALETGADGAIIAMLFQPRGFNALT
jgi:Uncharacterized conserved protein (DUF2190)